MTPRNKNICFWVFLLSASINLFNFYTFYAYKTHAENERLLWWAVFCWLGAMVMHRTMKSPEEQEL